MFCIIIDDKKYDHDSFTLGASIHESYLFTDMPELNAGQEVGNKKLKMIWRA